MTKDTMRSFHAVATMTARFEDGRTVTVAAQVPARENYRRAPHRAALEACLDMIEERHEGRYEVLSISTPASILRDLTLREQSLLNEYRYEAAPGRGADIIGHERATLRRLRHRPRLFFREPETRHVRARRARR